MTRNGNAPPAGAIRHAHRARERRHASRGQDIGVRRAQRPVAQGLGDHLPSHAGVEEAHGPAPAEAMGRHPEGGHTRVGEHSPRQPGELPRREGLRQIGGGVERLEQPPPEHGEGVGHEPRREQAGGQLGDRSGPRSQGFRPRPARRAQSRSQPAPEDTDRLGVERQQALQPVAGVAHQPRRAAALARERGGLAGELGVRLRAEHGDEHEVGEEQAVAQLALERIVVPQGSGVEHGHVCRRGAPRPLGTGREARPGSAPSGGALRGEEDGDLRLEDGGGRPPPRPRRAARRGPHRLDEGVVRGGRDARRLTQGPDGVDPGLRLRISQRPPAALREELSEEAGFRGQPGLPTSLRELPPRANGAHVAVPCLRGFARGDSPEQSRGGGRAIPRQQGRSGREDRLRSRPDALEASGLTRAATEKLRPHPLLITKVEEGGGRACRRSGGRVRAYPRPTSGLLPRSGGG